MSENAGIAVVALDHLVLTVADIDRTCAFYTRALGMRVERFGAGRIALRFGDQKINLHQADRTFDPKAAVPTRGSADLCFLISGTIEAAQAHLMRLGLTIEAGPVDRTGATGPIRSLYLRDPDGNLVELAVPALR
ncbi:MAG: VOC family protein [Rhodospirillaceae bacterium]|nr:VOC family protein [Rhodospirillaceae bacterium]